MTTLEILTAARAKIEKGWCERTNARDANGKPVLPGSDEAVRWCANGAIQCFPYDILVFRLLVEFTGTDLDVWNDAPGRTQAEVIQLFDAAIEAARKEQDAI